MQWSCTPHPRQTAKNALEIIVQRLPEYDRGTLFEELLKQLLCVFNIFSLGDALATRV